jgi:hypothetical protein
MDKLNHLKHPLNLRLIAFGSMTLISMGIFLFTMVVSNQNLGYKAKAACGNVNKDTGNCENDIIVNNTKVEPGSDGKPHFVNDGTVTKYSSKPEDWDKVPQGQKDRQNPDSGTSPQQPIAVKAPAVATSPTTVPTSTPVPTASPTATLTPTPATGQGIFVIINNSSLGTHQINGIQAMLTKTCQDVSTNWLSLGADSIKTIDQVKIPATFLNSHPGYSYLIAPNKTNSSIYECIPLPN